MKRLEKKLNNQFSVIVMRVFIGWHFFYEGIIKAYNSDWSAKAYLMNSEGLLKEFFQWLGSDNLIGIVDMTNIGVLLFVGLTLILGIFEKPAALIGALLLLLYTLAYPPFPWLNQGLVEGNYWLINKNLIELAALLVIYQTTTGHIFGIESILEQNSNPEKIKSHEME